MLPAGAVVMFPTVVPAFAPVPVEPAELPLPVAFEDCPGAVDDDAPPEDDPGASEDRDEPEADSAEAAG